MATAKNANLTLPAIAHSARDGEQLSQYAESHL